ncbi:hypothetical protein McanCB56680_006101 [Microsporum canis]|uniref:Lipid droplet-associated hydrolase n=1 Tax=Arthroderma otae (strain ATCC MYA-4605 / CBS 113480) TaxID=554155 RepID=C5FJB6_ARTOC|nr:conserved hypothetical protein [Microsporum canis CBS 113480]EEQ29537.1 conserved hypothetical protein [Microsporum canis CBS 113480]
MSTYFNLKAHITPNSFLTCAFAGAGSGKGSNASILSRTSTLVYFISGNPGLISYYHLFFSLLSSELSSQPNGSYIIRGRSLGGFEVPDPQSKTVEQQQEDSKKSPTRLYSLGDQIAFMERDLEEFVRAWQDAVQAEHALEERPRANVIVMGHSVGAYIAMEIMRRRREKAGLQKRMGMSDGVLEQTASVEGDRLGLDIIGGIMLFPTVVDIAKSPNGRVLTKLLYIPYLPLLVSMLAGFLVCILPELVLYRIVSYVMRNPRKEAVETTVSMLKNAPIVRQALHMAADEMREISADKWSDELWGFGSPTNTPKDRLTKMIFYFGRNDHWVAETTREEIIQSKTKAKQSAPGPVLTVCEDGVVHGFCIGHSEIMANKVGKFIKDIVRGSELDN